MGQRCVHYTEPDNGTRVLYAHNQWGWLFCMMVRAMQVFIKQLKYNSEFKIKNRDVIFRVKIVTSENRCIP